VPAVSDESGDEVDEEAELQAFREFLESVDPRTSKASRAQRAGLSCERSESGSKPAQPRSAKSALATRSAAQTIGIQPRRPPRWVDAEEHADRRAEQERRARPPRNVTFVATNELSAHAPPPPTRMPTVPPSTESTIASMTNCDRMSYVRAPTALRIPISRVRSEHAHEHDVHDADAATSSEIEASPASHRRERPQNRAEQAERLSLA